MWIRRILKGPVKKTIFFLFHFSKVILFENKLPKFHDVSMKNKDLVAEKIQREDQSMCYRTFGMDSDRNYSVFPRKQ